MAQRRAGAERLGFLAHELRNLINTAILAFEVLKTGNVGVGGSTGAVLHRSLVGLRALIGRSLAEVRLTQGIQNADANRRCPSSSTKSSPPRRMDAQTHAASRLTVMPVEAGMAIEADRQVLAAVVGNLLQNAFKFTRPRTTVTLRVRASAERVLIEVEDECGGLPDGECRRTVPPVRAAQRRSHGPGPRARVQPMGRRSEPRPDLRAGPARLDACSRSICRGSPSPHSR